MEIEFVKGTCKISDYNVVHVSGYKPAAGFFEAPWEDYKWWKPNMVLAIRVEKPKITVVKQKYWWQTLKILLHELAHAFVYKFLSKSRNNKYHRWLDKY